MGTFELLASEAVGDPRRVPEEHQIKELACNKANLGHLRTAGGIFFSVGKNIV